MLQTRGALSGEVSLGSGTASGPTFDWAAGAHDRDRVEWGVSAASWGWRVGRRGRAGRVVGSIGLFGGGGVDLWGVGAG